MQHDAGKLLRLPSIITAKNGKQEIAEMLAEVGGEKKRLVAPGTDNRYLKRRIGSH